MAITDFSLAGSDTLGSYAPNQLFSGEIKVVTKRAYVEAGLVLDKYTVMARNVAGNYVPLDPTQTDGRQLAKTILMTAINTTAAQATTPLGVVLPANPAGAVATFTEFYEAGMFNPAMLVWPASLTTPVSKARVFDTSMISILSPL